MGSASRDYSSNAYSDAPQRAMAIRRQSQGLDLKNQRSAVKKVFTSKIGTGKVVAEYLPQINNGNMINFNDSYQIENKEVTSSIERKANNIRLKLSDKNSKAYSVPID